MDPKQPPHRHLTAHHISGRPDNKTPRPIPVAAQQAHPAAGADAGAQAQRRLPAQHIRGRPRRRLAGRQAQQLHVGRVAAAEQQHRQLPRLLAGGHAHRRLQQVPAHKGVILSIIKTLVLLLGFGCSPVATPTGFCSRSLLIRASFSGFFNPGSCR